jgi:poly(A) polymerase Pap1
LWDVDELVQLGYGLRIFGSYSLKTNSFDADIDMISVVPEFFSREKHFNNILTEELKKHPFVKEVFAIRT